MEPLKNLIHPELVRNYAREIKKYHPGFKDQIFLQNTLNEDWEVRELKDRINHLAVSIHEQMYLPFDQQMDVLDQVAEQMPTGFEYLVFPTVVEKFGTGEVERSLQSLHWLTRFSTAEFAIRPFLKDDPERIFQQLLIWSEDENEHVRRLASEGCRPRLPWGGNLKFLMQDPGPIFPILENLKNDPSLYVRKSVANNLNDISKDNPDQVLDRAKRWQKKGSKETQWIVKHALRGLLKQPHPKALEMFGYGDANQVNIQGLQIETNKPKKGEDLYFSFELSNGKEQAKLRLEYVIDYQKKNGTLSPKVFQISEGEWTAGENRTFRKKQSLADMTTRKHHPGLHRLSIRVNGAIKSTVEFELIT